ncbi:MAG: hypothetical protein HRU19_19615 [Pseudobacteriovorax sp.]|nr:hypothetical protein [Pseudobacteriovorax sp.]
MSEQDYGGFIVKIIETLQKNGFPEKKVALPLEKLYESAYDRGLNLNKVLEYLKSEEKIDHEKTTEKIIFSSLEEASTTSSDFDWSKAADMLQKMSGGNPGDLLKQAQEIMSKMPPEQMQQMMETFKNMSPEKKDELVKQGKDLGFIPKDT